MLRIQRELCKRSNLGRVVLLGGSREIGRGHLNDQEQLGHQELEQFSAPFPWRSKVKRTPCLEANSVDSISCCGWNHCAWKQCSNEPWTSEPEILGYRSGSAAYWLWHWTSCPRIFILHVNNVHNNNCQPPRIALSIPCQGNGLV